MENSPPGIHTILSGALPPGEFLFAMVGRNSAVPQNAEASTNTIIAQRLSVRRVQCFIDAFLAAAQQPNGFNQHALTQVVLAVRPPARNVALAAFVADQQPINQSQGNPARVAP